MTTFHLPDLGEGLQEAEIVSWHVSPGDHVVADQPLLSVETDKAVVEVPAPWSGTVTALLADAGEIAAIGAPLAEIDTGPSADTGAIVGTLPGAGGRARAAPAVRRLAAERGVDLAALDGSGPDGAITRADVEAAADAGGGGGTTAAWQPLRGVRRAMARNMSAARDSVATTAIFDEADITGWAEGADITIRLARAIAAGCAAEPALNAWFDDARMARHLHRTVDLGIAVDTADGLFVPVLRDVGNRAAEDLRAGLQRMRADIEARAIPRDEMRGQTITLSNFGMIGGRHALMTVIPPQVAIVGAGRIGDAPGIVDGRVAPRRKLPVSLTFDHRIVTGAEAARFLTTMIRTLEHGTDGA
ncbi:2-oxo acid dehydrogenase subunit E2 [Rhodobacteraceae bacterium 2CG4]|uniref:Dihydrolipoamide acetyltransferase component of pyruvate dehydrogenase complex n=1 Tax=Halovulum marinum TaxID=2662447 RepID=A0A6L5YYB0_9RHOB|nr:dihydrolipoamide acetyltransferase family protein [Halovulum marinum]MSU89276.1 2-oxo acid dehydrogenase subunit E2 [Halovulum marinum]